MPSNRQQGSFFSAKYWRNRGTIFNSNVFIYEPCCTNSQTGLHCFYIIVAIKYLMESQSEWSLQLKQTTFFFFDEHHCDASVLSVNSEVQSPSFPHVADSRAKLHDTCTRLVTTPSASSHCFLDMQTVQHFFPDQIRCKNSRLM